MRLLTANQPRCLRALLCFVCALAPAACIKLARHNAPRAGMNAPLPAQTDSPTQPRLNINTATPAELEKLPGIGAGLAARIIEQRTRYGPFRRVEHLLLVRGISERRFEQMRAFITAE